ncbi:MAG TPA: hypothetical protein DCQ43_06705, partial [Treponema sp.]|nr:hypothetical protein [Treponema sp.]
PESTSFTSESPIKATVAAGTLTVTGVATGTSYITVTMTKNGSTLKKQILTASIIANHSVPKANLNTWLAGLPANDKNTPYKINITGLTESDIQQQENGQLKQGTLRAILQSNSTKYVDLSSTTLPAIESIKAALAGCSSLIRAPAIPSGVKNMSDCFSGCSNLQSPVVIPNGVENMWGTFQDCTSLTTAPELPSTLSGTNGCGLVRTFSGCTSLTQAPSSIPSGVTNMNYCFNGCSKLSTVPDLPVNVTSIVCVFNGCKINGTTVYIYGLIENSSDCDNAFAGNPRVFVRVEFHETGMALESADGWDDQNMAFGLIP